MSKQELSHSILARQIAAHTNLWSLPAVPFFLLPRIQEQPEDGEEQSTGAASHVEPSDSDEEVDSLQALEQVKREIVALYWNEAADLLNGDSSRHQAYLSLRQVVASLRDRLESTDLLDGWYGQEVIIDVLLKGGKRYGADTTLFNSLGVDLKPRTSGTYWLFISEVEPYDSGDPREGYYRLLFPGCDDPSRKDTFIAETFRTFRASSSWDDCWRPLQQTGPYLPHPLKAKREEIFRFRLELLEGVLSQYEVLGYVARVDPVVMGDIPVRYDSQAKRFIKETMRLIGETDEQGRRGYDSRTKILQAVARQMRYSNWEDVRDIADDLGPYRKSSGKRGRYKKDLEASELDYFKREIRRISADIDRHDSVTENG